MILVTGGTGFIGSHTVVELMAAGREILIVDNFSNSRPAVLDRLAHIVGRRPAFVELDIRDRMGLRALFKSYPVDAVIHFAGFKAVGESVAQPLRYYDNNVSGSVALFETMAEHDVKTLVFSSSATVYGDPHTVPVGEDFPLQVASPYGRSKLMIEEVLRDVARSDSNWRIALLRYFNPVGAHASGLIGENCNDAPNNLMPYIAEVADGRREYLSIFGNDYPTVDGTGVRDYIHVVDLAIGHVKVLQKLDAQPGIVTYNLGTGRGHSVLEVVKAFEKASGRQVPCKIVARRPGDVAEYYADPGLIERELGWKAERDLEQMCADSWKWQCSREK